MRLLYLEVLGGLCGRLLWHQQRTFWKRVRVRARVRVRIKVKVRVRARG